MAHILMCWELGGDLGHVARMKPLAEALHARGHRVSFVVREPVSADKLLDPKRFAWFQAPYQTQAVPSPLLPPRNFAAVMHNTGFHSEQALLGRLHAWRNLYAGLKPDLLVFDHSPTALLAARGIRTRRIVLGTGFGIPPDASPLPLFDPKDDSPEIAAAEQGVLGVANAALSALGEPSLVRIADIYAAQAALYFTFKELDHYGPRDGADYWGPTQQDAGIPTAWPGGTGKRVFAYLKPFENLPALLKTLQEAGHPTLIYLGKGSDAARRQFQGGNLAFSERPVDLNAAVAKADLVVCHSGHGTISAALLKGRPLLLLPLNMEQRMLSARVMEMGAGLAAPALAPEGMRQKFQRLLAEPAFTEAARGFAERHAGFEVQGIPGRFVTLVERLLASEAL